MGTHGRKNGDVSSSPPSTAVDGPEVELVAVPEARGSTHADDSTIPATGVGRRNKEDLPPTLADDPERTLDHVALGPESTDAPDHHLTRLSADGQDPDYSDPLSSFVRAVAAEDRPRDHVPGYHLLAVLGRGGMGIVYKARDLRLNRLVALKMIRDDSQASADYLRRFQVEAEVLALLRHPNIVPIYEIDTAFGRPFVALELLEGGTLARRLAGAPQPDRDAAQLLITLARAVHAAHEAGIVHRDLKPSNVLFDRDGVPKITDFGLAKRLTVEEGDTRTGQVIGTPSYMAPEQAEGRVRDVGRAADVYALGAILYEMLTGRPPFRGETSAETLKLVLTEQVIPPSRLRPKIPRDIETICLKCLLPEPQKRYADALALANDLERYLNGAPVVARRTPWWECAWKWTRRHPAAVLVVVLVLGAAAAGAVARHRAASRARITSRQEVERVARLRHTVDTALFDAQKALAERQWVEARRLVERPLSLVEREASLADLQDRARSLLDQAQRGLDAQRDHEQTRTRYERFLKERDEALFLDTRFTGLDTTARPEATRRAAESALAVFMSGPPNGPWTLAPLPRGLSSVEQNEIREGCYELLMILADAVAQSTGAEPAQRAVDALRILDQAAALRPATTRAYHWQRAGYLDLKGDTQDAARERDQAAALAPSDAYDHFLSGRERARRGEWDAAIADFNAVLQRRPEHFWAQCLLAVGYMQLHDPLKARPSLIACLQRRRDAAWLYLLRGLANAQVGELALDAAGRFPERAPALRAEAAAQFEAAEEDYRAALSRLPAQPERAELHYVLLVNRGQFRLQRGSLEEAEADLRAAAQLDEHRYEAPSALSRVYQKQGRTGDALEQCTRAIALRPQWSPLYRERADVLLHLDPLTSTQREAALADLEDAIRFEAPANHALIAGDRTNQARLLQQEGRHADALAACAEALALVPRHAGAHRVRIEALLALKRYDDLIESCDVALQSGKPSADLYALRGLAHDALGDHSSAINDYTMALNLPPRTASLLVRRGWAYLIQGAANPAVDDFNAAVELDRTNADAYNGRGLAHARLGKYREAVLDAEQALRHAHSDDWRAPFNAARIYAHAAVEAAAEARKQGPDVVPLVADYQDRAVALVQRALEHKSPGQRATFLQDTVLKDPAFQSLRRRLRALE